jgi:hypothetical protein
MNVGCKTGNMDCLIWQGQAQVKSAARVDEVQRSVSVSVKAQHLLSVTEWKVDLRAAKFATRAAPLNGPQRILESEVAVPHWAMSGC